MGPESQHEPCSEEEDKQLRALFASSTKDSFSSLSAFTDAEDTEDKDTDDDKVATTSSSEIMCPHCKMSFPDAEALGRHDKCMNMPTVDKKYKGVNFAGDFRRDCGRLSTGPRPVSLRLGPRRVLTTR